MEGKAGAVGIFFHFFFVFHYLLPYLFIYFLLNFFSPYRSPRLRETNEARIEILSSIFNVNEFWECVAKFTEA